MLVCWRSPWLTAQKKLTFTIVLNPEHRPSVLKTWYTQGVIPLTYGLYERRTGFVFAGVNSSTGSFLYHGCIHKDGDTLQPLFREWYLSRTRPSLLISSIGIFSSVIDFTIFRTRLCSFTYIDNNKLIQRSNSHVRYWCWCQSLTFEYFPERDRSHYYFISSLYIIKNNNLYSLLLFHICSV